MPPIGAQPSHYYSAGDVFQQHARNATVARDPIEVMLEAAPQQQQRQHGGTARRSSAGRDSKAAETLHPNKAATAHANRPKGKGKGKKGQKGLLPIGAAPKKPPGKK